MKKLQRQSPYKQETPQELLDACLGLLERKFYAGHPVSFAKDRPRLLQWVVLWPAHWFQQRGVTVPPDRYREIFFKVFLDALRFGNTENINYLPAWLAQVIKSHFACHGDELYAEAKTARNLVEHSVIVLSRLPHASPDPVRDLAAARRLLLASRKPRQPQKPPLNAQLNLL